MDRLVKIDGTLALKATESRCEMEQEKGYKLTKITFGTEILGSTVVPVNKAEFDLASSIDILNDLNFVQAKKDDKLDDIKGKMTGWTLMFETQMSVNNHVERVIVFGKQV